MLIASVPSLGSSGLTGARLNRQASPLQKPLLTTSSQRFSGSFAVQTARVFEPLFRATTEYIWELMMLDVVALWLPRIYNALSRGRVKTSMEQIKSDPRYERQSEQSQKATWVRKNLSGLNWSNGIEETWREIQSAPMVLVAQSLFYGSLMKSDVARKAVLLGKKDLAPLVTEFQTYANQHFAQNRPIQKLSTQEFRKFCQGFTEHLMQPSFSQLATDPIELRYIQDNATQLTKNWLSPKLFTKNLESQQPGQQFLDWLKKQFGPQVMEKPPTYKSLVTAWSKDWNKAMFNRAPQAKLNTLQSILEVLNLAYQEQIPNRVKSQDIFRLSTRGLGKITPANFTDAIDKFNDFIRATLGRTLKNPNSKMSLSEALGQSAKILERGLTIRKAGYSLAIMGFCIFLYFGSSVHAQSNNKYPANRLIGRRHDQDDMAPQFGPMLKPMGNKLSTLLQEKIKV